MQEFDDIYDKMLVKKYTKYEIQRLSKRKDRKRDIGAGRPFKMDLRDRFLMLLVYYRLYITYTLTGFLFDLDQSTICRDIQKIERLIRQCLPIPQKLYNITKRLKTPEEVEQYFPDLLVFTDCTDQQTSIPRPNTYKQKIFEGFNQIILLCNYLIFSFKSRSSYFWIHDITITKPLGLMYYMESCT